MDRRKFLAALAAIRQLPLTAQQTASVPIQVRTPSPHLAFAALIDPAHDKYSCEKDAALIESHLNRLLENRSLPLAADFGGRSPLPSRYRDVAPGVREAEFDGNSRRSEFEAGLPAWIASLGEVRRASFACLPDDQVRYEIASKGAYRVGLWRQVWRDGKLSEFVPLRETVVTAPEPYFEDITSTVLSDVPSFHNQLLGGNTWWRSRLDVACGIDLYAHNGIAVGDVDGDGRDEIYVCQQAGLPNRLYKIGPGGAWLDITERSGLGILDDTSSALFVNLRNSGRQDAVVLCSSGPLLFLNDGAGAYHLLPDAFRFATKPQGSFTGMAAADYDRDGRLDLYLCSYVYFQSEDQYRYPVPYHDARNGPPNFLFANRLTADGGYFEDVTAPAGLNHNNDRYSFAATWCDVDGDGWPDLYVANDFGRSNFYRNRNGQFRDESESNGATNIGPAMGVTAFDYDLDQRPDLYVSNMWTPAGQRVVRDASFGPGRTVSAAYRSGHTMGNALFRNKGSGSFQPVGDAAGAAMGRWAWSAGAFDFDNDGLPELLVACGMLTNPSKVDLDSFFWRQVVAHSPDQAQAEPSYESGWNAINQFIREDYSWSGGQPNVFYRPLRTTREGEVTYCDASGISGLDFAEDTRTFAALDVDGDGCLDVVLKNRLAPQIRVMRNRAGQGKVVLAMRLRGTKSNRDGIGARVEVNGRVQWVSAGSGYLAQHTKDLHFALASGGPATAKITWPSGLQQETGPLAGGFRHEVAEGSNEVRSVRFHGHEVKSGGDGKVEARNQPEPSSTWLFEPLAVPDGRRGPGFLLLFSGSNPWPGPSHVPIQAVNLAQGQEETAALYSIFRRYLFEYRTDLTCPLLLLLDGKGLAHKIYFELPGSEVLTSDLAMMETHDRMRLALPFAGVYHKAPERNLVKTGAAFYWAGYPNAALRYFEQASVRDPENWKALSAAAQIHLDAGRFEQARTAFERVLSIHHGAVSALFGAGQACAKLGDLGAAERLFSGVMAANPSDADAANQLGLIYERQNRDLDAKRLFERAIEMRRDHTPAINNLGVLYMKLSKVNDAIAAFRFGVKTAPDDSQAYLNLARALMLTGQRDRARACLLDLLQRKPHDSAAERALRELDASTAKDGQ